MAEGVEITRGCRMKQRFTELVNKYMSKTKRIQFPVVRKKVQFNLKFSTVLHCNHSLTVNLSSVFICPICTSSRPLFFHNCPLRRKTNPVSWMQTVTDPTIWQLISLVIHGLWWTVSRQAVVLTCTNGVSHNHLPVIVASDRPWTTLSLESTATAALAK